MLASETPQVLLHGDLHLGNVLDGGGSMVPCDRDDSGHQLPRAAGQGSGLFRNCSHSPGDGLIAGSTPGFTYSAAFVLKGIWRDTLIRLNERPSLRIRRPVANTTTGTQTATLPIPCPTTTPQADTPPAISA
jgi:hypothetical protein